MRRDRSPSLPQRVALDRVERHGGPYRCGGAGHGPDRQPKVCAPWLVAAWRHSGWAVVAVKERRLVLAELLPSSSWPPVVSTVADALGVDVPEQREAEVLPMRVPR